MDFADDGEEIICEGGSGSAEDIEFDLIVGALEEIILNDEFSQMQNSFCDEHCDIFQDNEENKIAYTELFHRYTELIEQTLETKLKLSFSDFDMGKFEVLLSSRPDELSGEVFDLLLSLGDFNEFKQLMLSHKKAKSAGADIQSLAVMGHHIKPVEGEGSNPPSPTR
mmetsp:Transcript_29196/g.29545  ORF Transcript_29196/g.29545 Transcript_29196/m.29545 type:complete len:167 (+) Transcript_29196:114-614(+)